MKRNTRLIGMGILIATCAVALAARDAITLKYAPKVGDTLHYKMTADMGSTDMPDLKATITADLTDKITKVDTDTYTVDSAQSNVQVSFNGQTASQPDGTSTTVFKSNGDIQDITSEEADPNMWRVAEINNFVYPDKPVNVGDEWTSTVTADSKKGTVAATTSYKVDSLEKVGNHNTAKIKVTYKETEGDKPASSDGYVWIDTTDGSMVKATATWTDVPIGNMPLSGTITVERVE